MSMDSRGTRWRRKIAENFNRLSLVHERYRRQTDDRRTGDSKAKAIRFTRMRVWKTSHCEERDWTRPAEQRCWSFDHWFGLEIRTQTPSLIYSRSRLLYCRCYSAIIATLPYHADKLRSDTHQCIINGLYKPQRRPLGCNCMNKAIQTSILSTRYITTLH